MKDELEINGLKQRILELEGRALEYEALKKALQSKEAQYQRIFESATDALLIFDRHGKIVQANPQACQMYGYSCDELIGLYREQIVHPDYHHLFPKFKQDVKERGKFSGESKDIRKDGTVLEVEVRGTEFDFRGRRHVLSIVRDISERKRAENALRKALSEIEQLKERLLSENILLRREIEVKEKHEAIIGDSDAVRNVLSLAEKVAGTPATVLLLGETGTGKELLARVIHTLSARKGRPMVIVNCSALPAGLVESELFGHEKGAYTGAMSKQIGRFEVAHRSTIFLDEVGELPMELQVKLLRVLQEGQFERLGSSATVKVDVRVIAATNQDLAKAVRDGRFREDLYYRLNVFPIFIPPLRERGEDIPLLVWSFIREIEKTTGKRIETISRKSMEELQHYAWPGNVRELRNLVERAMILARGPNLVINLPQDSRARVDPHLSLSEVERRHILTILERTGWRIRGESGAAAILGLKPTTLDSRMKKLGITRRQA